MALARSSNAPDTPMTIPTRRPLTFLVALTAILAGCGKDAEPGTTVPTGTDSAAVGKAQKKPNRGSTNPGSNDTGWDGVTEDGAKPPDGR